MNEKWKFKNRLCLPYQFVIKLSILILLSVVPFQIFTQKKGNKSKRIETGSYMPDLDIYDENGKPFKLNNIKGQYSVIVFGCLTCPRFLRACPQIEAVAADYTPLNVKFYYIYKILAHHENNGYVQAHTLDERLLHIKEAKQVLKTRVPWLIDNMKNEAYHRVAHGNDVEFILDPSGKIISYRHSTEPDKLRNDLAKLVEPSQKITTMDDLNLQVLVPSKEDKNNPFEPLKIESEMLPLLIKPHLKSSHSPFYAKLRIEVSPELYNTGKGKMYIGFYPDPIYQSHWNNLAEPLQYKISTSGNMKIQPLEGKSKKIKEMTDTFPREFLVDVSHAKEDDTFEVEVKYYICFGKNQVCTYLKQKYTVDFRYDPNASRSHIRRSSKLGGIDPRPGKGKNKGKNKSKKSWMKKK